MVSIPAGIYAAIYPKNWLSRIVMAFSTIGVAIPVFLTAIAFIYFFSVELNWLPSYGRGETVKARDYRDLSVRAGRHTSGAQHEAQSGSNVIPAAWEAGAVGAHART